MKISRRQSILSTAAVAAVLASAAVLTAPSSTSFEGLIEDCRERGCQLAANYPTGRLLVSDRTDPWVTHHSGSYHDRSDRFDTFDIGSIAELASADGLGRVSRWLDSVHAR